MSHFLGLTINIYNIRLEVLSQTFPISKKDPLVVVVPSVSPVMNPVPQVYIGSVKYPVDDSVKFWEMIEEGQMGQDGFLRFTEEILPL
jgi:hypothetical protein